MNQVVPSFLSLKKFLSLVFYGKHPSKIRYKSILKILDFWRDAPIKDIYKSVTLRASFKELTTEPINLVNKIYQFMGINMGAEYKKELTREAQMAKSFKSEHRYSLTAFDLDSLNSEYH